MFNFHDKYQKLITQNKKQNQSKQLVGLNQQIDIVPNTETIVQTEFKVYVPNDTKPLLMKKPYDFKILRTNLSLWQIIISHLIVRENVNNSDDGRNSIVNVKNRIERKFNIKLNESDITFLEFNMYNILKYIYNDAFIKNLDYTNIGIIISTIYNLNTNTKDKLSIDKKKNNSLNSLIDMLYHTVYLNSNYDSVLLNQEERYLKDLSSRIKQLDIQKQLYNSIDDNVENIENDNIGNTENWQEILDRCLVKICSRLHDYKCDIIHQSKINNEELTAEQAYIKLSQTKEFAISSNYIQDVQNMIKDLVSLSVLECGNIDFQIQMRKELINRCTLSNQRLINILREIQIFNFMYIIEFIRQCNITMFLINSKNFNKIPSLFDSYGTRCSDVHYRLPQNDNNFSPFITCTVSDEQSQYDLIIKTIHEIDDILAVSDDSNINVKNDIKHDMDSYLTNSSNSLIDLLSKIINIIITLVSIQNLSAKLFTDICIYIDERSEIKYKAALSNCIGNFREYHNYNKFKYLHHFTCILFKESVLIDLLQIFTHKIDQQDSFKSQDCDNFSSDTLNLDCENKDSPIPRNTIRNILQINTLNLNLSNTSTISNLIGTTASATSLKSLDKYQFMSHLIHLNDMFIGNHTDYTLDTNISSILISTQESYKLYLYRAFSKYIRHTDYEDYLYCNWVYGDVKRVWVTDCDLLNQEFQKELEEAEEGDNDEDEHVIFNDKFKSQESNDNESNNDSIVNQQAKLIKQQQQFIDKVIKSGDVKADSDDDDLVIDHAMNRKQTDPTTVEKINIATREIGQCGTFQRGGIEIENLSGVYDQFNQDANNRDVNVYLNSSNQESFNQESSNQDLKSTDKDQIYEDFVRNEKMKKLFPNHDIKQFVDSFKSLKLGLSDPKYDNDRGDISIPNPKPKVYLQGNVLSDSLNEKMKIDSENDADDDFYDYIKNTKPPKSEYLFKDAKLPSKYEIRSIANKPDLSQFTTVYDDMQKRIDDSAEKVETNLSDLMFYYKERDEVFKKHKQDLGKAINKIYNAINKLSQDNHDEHLVKEYATKNSGESDSAYKQRLIDYQKQYNTYKDDVIKKYNQQLQKWSDELNNVYNETDIIKQKIEELNSNYQIAKYEILENKKELEKSKLEFQERITKGYINRLENNLKEQNDVLDYRNKLNSILKDAYNKNQLDNITSTLLDDQRERSNQLRNKYRDILNELQNLNFQNIERHLLDLSIKAQPIASKTHNADQTDEFLQSILLTKVLPDIHRREVEAELQRQIQREREEREERLKLEAEHRARQLELDRAEAAERIRIEREANDEKRKIAAEERQIAAEERRIKAEERKLERELREAERRERQEENARLKQRFELETKNRANEILEERRKLKEEERKRKLQFEQDRLLRDQQEQEHLKVELEIRKQQEQQRLELDRIAKQLNQESIERNRRELERYREFEENQLQAPPLPPRVPIPPILPPRTSISQSSQLNRTPSGSRILEKRPRERSITPVQQRRSEQRSKIQDDSRLFPKRSAVESKNTSNVSAIPLSPPPDETERSRIAKEQFYLRQQEARRKREQQSRDASPSVEQVKIRRDRSVSSSDRRSKSAGVVYPDENDVMMDYLQSDEPVYMTSVFVNNPNDSIVSDSPIDSPTSENSNTSISRQILSNKNTPVSKFITDKINEYSMLDSVPSQSTRSKVKSLNQSPGRRSRERKRQTE